MNKTKLLESYPGPAQPVEELASIGRAAYDHTFKNGEPDVNGLLNAMAAMILGADRVRERARKADEFFNR